MFSSEYKQGKEASSFAFSMPGFLKAVLTACAFTLVVFFVCALLLTYTGLPEGAIPFIVIMTLVLSVLIAGIVNAGAAGRYGYLYGGLAGLLYVLLLYLVSLLIAGSFHFSSYILILLVIGLLGGAAGGIVGINLKGKRRR